MLVVECWLLNVSLRLPCPDKPRSLRLKPSNLFGRNSSCIWRRCGRCWTRSRARCCTRGRGCRTTGGGIGSSKCACAAGGWRMPSRNCSTPPFPRWATPKVFSRWPCNGRNARCWPWRTSWRSSKNGSANSMTGARRWGSRWSNCMVFWALKWRRPSPILTRRSRRWKPTKVSRRRARKKPGKQHELEWKQRLARWADAGHLGPLGGDEGALARREERGIRAPLHGGAFGEREPDGDDHGQTGGAAEKSEERL